LYVRQFDYTTVTTHPESRLRNTIGIGDEETGGDAKYPIHTTTATPRTISTKADWQRFTK
jgi:hypothetical protein